jgi:cytochrome c553
MSKIAISAIILWLIAALVVGVVFFKSGTAPSSDGRTAIYLAPTERDFILGEMRKLLIYTQKITSALAEGDRAKASKTARLASNHGGHTPPVTLMAKLPLEFERAGMAMHAGFEEFAAAVEKGDASSALTGRLADLLDACVGCHETYRVDPAK